MYWAHQKKKNHKQWKNVCSVYYKAAVITCTSFSHDGRQNPIQPFMCIQTELSIQLTQI